MCRTRIASRLSAWISAQWPPSFGLREDIDCFVRSQWPIPQPVFIVYRVFLACYTLTWLIMSITNAGRTTGAGGFFVFLTNWTYIVLCLYLIIACISTTYASFRARRASSDAYPGASNQSEMDHSPERSPALETTEAEDRTEDAEDCHSPTPLSQLPVYFRVTWVLLNVCLTFNPIISLIYWVFIFNPEFVYARQGGAFGVALTIHRHALNSLFAYLDLAVSSIPVRFGHFVYPCAYGLLYTFFSLVYYWAGGRNPYFDSPAIYPTLLDWTTPVKTLLIIVGFVFILIAFHSLAFGWYRLRAFVANRLLSQMVLKRYNCNTLSNQPVPQAEDDVV